MMNGQQTMFLDQYGEPVWAKSLKELRGKVGGGAVSKMYTHKKDGSTVPVYATAHAARAALTGRYRVDPAQLRYVPLSLGKEWEDLNHGTKFVIERVPVEEG